jgi:YD repeat-containing protein
MTNPLWLYRYTRNLDSNGFAELYDSKKKGKIIYKKNDCGEEEWREYDTKGKLIKYYDSNGYEKEYHYDDINRKIYVKTNYRSDHQYVYDANNNLIYITDDNDKQFENAFSPISITDDGIVI